MLNSLLLSKRWCNLVFEGRNKEYGAYVLRRNEGKYMLWALIAVCGTFVLLVATPVIALKWQLAAAEKEPADAVANFSKLKKPEHKHKKDYELKVVDIAQRVNVRKVKDAIKFTPEISPDESVESQLILGTDAPGKPTEGPVVVAVPDSMLAANDSMPDPGVSSRFPSPVEVVEQMPQFPGGLKGLMQWLTENLYYPPICVRNKVQGRVEVSFLVDADGNVKNPQVTKKVHPLLDREALLTIKRMPRWEPGKVHGKVSVVRVTVPVVFSF